LVAFFIELPRMETVILTVLPSYSGNQLFL